MQGKNVKVFIETSELTFGNLFENFSPRFAFKVPLSSGRQGDKRTRQRSDPTEILQIMRHFKIFHEYELGAKKPITKENAVSLCMLFNVQIPHLK